MKPALPTSEAEEQANTAMVEMSYLFTPGPLIQHLYEMHKLRDLNLLSQLEDILGGWDADNWTVPRLYAMTKGGYLDVFEDE